ncbi:MAG: phosphatidylglycerophosphatase A [Myxococcales bacterium]
MTGPAGTPPEPPQPGTAPDPAQPGTAQSATAQAPATHAATAQPSGAVPAPVVVRKPRRLPGDRGPAPKLALAWATFFGAGYVPVAPGTAGTLAAIPLWWGLTYASWPVYVLATVTVTLTGIAAADRAGRYFGVADSGHIVVDEVAGYLVTMFLLPRTALAAIAGFVLFRLFDVLKPPPARFFDRDPRWKNGAGVVLDDVFAGVWAFAGTWGIQTAASHLGLT